MSHQPRLIPDAQQNQVDEGQQAAYRERLRQKLQEPEFRQIEGFPLGEDEDILALSDPPYYTACPNPFLPEIIEQWQNKRRQFRVQLGLPDDSDNNGSYHREPFATDISEGKYHPLYRLHPYSTKVPHQAIMRFVLHYTDPGDIVFDGFSGTGMTGLATQLCGNKKAVEELGYIVSEQNTILDRDKNVSQLGARFSILNDLSSAASFISYGCNAPVETDLQKKAQSVFKKVDMECGWMYRTLHKPSLKEIDKSIELLKSGKLEASRDRSNQWGDINYVAWSDVFVCPECGVELVFWDVAVDSERGKIEEVFSCSSCSATLTKNSLERTWDFRFDSLLDETIKQTKRVPVLISYSFGKKRFTKKPDLFDLELIEEIYITPITKWIPLHPMLFKGENWGETWRAGYHAGITHAHHFYTKRNLHTISSFLHHGQSADFLFAVTKVASQITNMYRFTHQSGTWGAGGGPLSGTLYIPSLIKELSIINPLKNAVATQIETRATTRPSNYCISTSSSSELLYIPDNLVDYIFVDPPFGGNLMYSELNFLWESWIKVFTNNKTEAIESAAQSKGALEYQSLMTSCFKEFYRILKPGRWMTVEFHNSQNRTWNAIQEALQHAGFIVADIRTLDKKKKTYKQVTSINAVNKDLIISAYKPHSSFERLFLREAGTVNGAWDFLQQHLRQLPPPALEDGIIETLSERQDYLLFDRMVAFHIQRGATVPMSASEFYAGLRQRFIERDGMFFLPDQVPEYDKARLQAQEVAQLTLFVTDEKSSIQWLRQQLAPDLGGHPQTYQDIQPKFLRQLHQLKHEALPELREILEENFLQDEAGRWYVPDPNKASDLEKIRIRALLREFSNYLTDKKKLRQFRSEAVRAGFAHFWNQKEYATIVQVAERLPESVLQEDPDLLMYYDNASLLTG